MLSGRVWPGHPVPFEDELLSSWLFRFARANGEKLHSFTKRTVPSHQVWNRDIDKSAALKLLLPLAYKSGQSVERLYHTTLWPYAGRLYGKPAPDSHNRWVLHAGVYHRSRRRYGLQYCPLCLAEHPPYFRRRWRLAFVTVCLEHGTLLRDRCPDCNAPIAPHKVDMGVHTLKTEPSATPVTACYQCGGDLSKGVSSSLEVIHKSVGRFQAMLLEALEAGSKMLPDHGEVSSVDYFDGVRQLVSVLAGTRHTIPFSAYVAERVGLQDPYFGLGDTPNDLEYQPLTNRHHLLGMAAWLLEDWPHRFTRAYGQTEMAPSYLLGDMDEVPTWLEQAVTTAQAERLRQAVKRPSKRTGDDIGEQVKAVLQDFLEHGAESLVVARQRIGDLESLLAERYLTTLESPLGTTVVLAARGRVAVSNRRHALPTPENAAGQVMRRRAREMLEVEGWQYLQKEGRFLISLRSCEGVKHYLLCGYGRYGARTVRRNFANLLECLVKEQAILLVVSDKPKELMGLEGQKLGLIKLLIVLEGSNGPRKFD